MSSTRRRVISNRFVSLQSLRMSRLFANRARCRSSLVGDEGLDALICYLCSGRASDCLSEVSEVSYYRSFSTVPKEPDRSFHFGPHASRSEKSLLSVLLKLISSNL